MRMEHPLPDSVVAFSTINKGFWILGSEGKLCCAKDSQGGSGAAEVAPFNLAAWKKPGMLCWLPKFPPSHWDFRAADVKIGFFHLENSWCPFLGTDVLGRTEPAATKLNKKLPLLPFAGQFLGSTPSGIISQFCLPTDPISLCFKQFLTSLPQHR